ncbi:MAG: alpha/beta fold hydrolase [Acidobacteria bacterium]|nr:alpha/beta fold hydrolase [Acidobacteriota bacterium]
MNRETIIEHLAQIPFLPHPAIKNGHAQTIFGSFIPRPTPLLNALAKPRFFDVAPPSRVLGDWSVPANATPTRALILLHGMEGSIASGYMRGTAEQALAAGFRVLRLNHRNCGGTESLTPTLYHAGLTDDVRRIVAELIEKDGLREIFIAGYSLGGNVALKLAGEYGSAIPAQVKGFIAVSPSMDLSSCANAIEMRSNFLYHARFIISLRNRMKRKARLFPEEYDIKKLNGIWTIRQFDDTYTSRHAGFRDVHDYYERASAIRVIKKIAVPTLIIQAKDDPFIPFAPFESRELQENANIILLATEHGGHVGFISASKDAAERFWYEKIIVAYANQLCL